MPARISLVLSVAAFACLGLLPLDAGEPAGVDITPTPEAIDFSVGRERIARYHTDPALAKPYLWPVKGPGGVPLTRAWPMEQAPPGGSTDHPHQKSAWFCHGDVIPEGLRLKRRRKGPDAVEGVDFWSETPDHGRIVCTHVAAPEGRSTPQGPEGRVQTHNEWRTADGRKILDEARTIRLYNFGAAQLFVFDIDLEASVVPITFGDTKEGSFGIRINDAIREEHGPGRIENADGKVGEKNCWGRLSAWCDYSGPLGGRTVGIAILDDPRNPSPACWHSRGYGLMAANPFGRARSGFRAMKGRTDLVRLPRGEHLKFRYGLLIHPGNAKTGSVAEYFERFVKLKG